MQKIMFNDKYGLTQAVLDGRKTQTRRLALHRSKYECGDKIAIAQSYHELNKRGFIAPEWCDHSVEDSPGYRNKMFVSADLMPHVLKITNVAMQKLNEITDSECIKEGVEPWINSYIVCGIMEKSGKNNICFNTPQEAFAELIERIYGKGTWDWNPLVYVYTFELIS